MHKRVFAVPLDSPPPHSLEAESSLLGCMLLDHDALTKGLSRFPPDAFYAMAHATIRASMAALQHAGREIDILTVGDWLEQAGKLDEIPNGRAYLTSLCEATFSPVMFSSYADRVERDWKKRQLLNLGLRLHHASQNGADLDELVDDIERTLTSVKTVPAEPQVQRTGDDFLFIWPSGITIAVMMLHETTDGVHGEVSVEIAGGRVDWGRLSLASRSQRRDLVRKLEDLRRGFSWDQALETVCYEVTQQYRTGEPVVALQPVEHPQQNLIAKLLPEGDPTVLFAPPDAGKGWVALLCAISLSTGKPLPGGLQPQRRASTLYLDWEWTQQAHERRLKRLAAGLDAQELDGIFYRRMTRPLADDVAFLRREIQRLDVGFIVLDSYFLAAGVEPYSPDAAGRLFAALRALGPVTSLILTHTSWEQTERTAGHGRPIGTVQVRGQARSEWELRRVEDDEDDTLTIGLYHTKVNDGRKHAPIGLRFEFTDGLVRLRAHEVADEPDLASRMSLADRIQAALRSGARTIEKLADDIEAKPQSVARVLRRLRKAGKVVVLDESLEKQSLWGLKS